MELAGRPDQLVFSSKVKEDLAMLTIAELYSPIELGKYKGMLVIEALPKLFKDVMLGNTSASKTQQAAIIRWYDQYYGRGEVAAEQKDAAEASGPKFVLIGNGPKKDPPTIPAHIVPTLEE